MPTYANSSIYNLIRPQQPLPDPVQDYAGMVQLKNLIRTDRDAEAANAAWAQSGGDLTKFSQLLSQTGGSYKSAIEVKKAGLDALKTTGEIENKKLDSLTKTAAIWRDAIAGTNDDAGMLRLRETGMSLFGPDAVAKMQIPDRFDPAWQIKNVQKGDDIIKQLEGQRNRAVTMRGQDKPIWDAERGVFVPQPGTTGMGGGPGPLPTKPIYDPGRGAFITPPPRVPGAMGVPPAGGAISVPGLPKKPSEIKADEAKAKAALVEKTRADIVIKKVDEALGQTGFFTTGLTGATLGLVPGTSAYDLDATIDTIKANVGFKELQDMRAASPTGGALGQIAVRELEFLQAAVASLHKGQSQDQVEKNLSAVKTHFENWKKTVEGTEVGTKPVVPSVAPGAGGSPNREAIDAELRRRGVIR